MFSVLVFQPLHDDKIVGCLLCTSKTELNSPAAVIRILSVIVLDHNKGVWLVSIAQNRVIPCPIYHAADLYRHCVFNAALSLKVLKSRIILARHPTAITFVFSVLVFQPLHDDKIVGCLLCTSKTELNSPAAVIRILSVIVLDHNKGVWLVSIAQNRVIPCPIYHAADLYRHCVFNAALENLLNSSPQFVAGASRPTLFEKCLMNFLRHSIRSTRFVQRHILGLVFSKVFYKLAGSPFLAVTYSCVARATRFTERDMISSNIFHKILPVDLLNICGIPDRQISLALRQNLVDNVWVSGDYVCHKASIKLSSATPNVRHKTFLQFTDRLGSNVLIGVVIYKRLKVHRLHRRRVKHFLWRTENPDNLLWRTAFNQLTLTIVIISSTCKNNVLTDELTVVVRPDIIGNLLP